MKKNFALGFVLVALTALSVTSCFSIKSIKATEILVTLRMPTQSVPQIFRDLDKPISLRVSSTVNTSSVIDDEELPKGYFAKGVPYKFSPEISEFAEESTRSYMQQMRFDLDPSADYRLSIELTQLKISYVKEDKKTYKTKASMTLLYRLTDNAGQTLIPSKTVAVSEMLEGVLGDELGRLYGKLLNKIDWSRIASYLKVADQASQEKNAKVTGEGDTALEHTVIRWYITSAPQGADVSWRVVSSTPEVSNTNSNYVGTTPYETTESFDIKGMTYNNSGNIQIEVTCERPGYLPQKKRFNLRQAIDQKEISAKFNLVKEDE